jgi:hypothetical protein
VEADNIWTSTPGYSFGEYARCRGLGEEVFITPGNSFPVVKKVCLACPAMVQCAMYGQSHDLYGVWGGLRLNPDKEWRDNDA